VFQPRLIHCCVADSDPQLLLLLSRVLTYSAKQNTSLVEAPLV